MGQTSLAVGTDGSDTDRPRAPRVSEPAGGGNQAAPADAPDNAQSGLKSPLRRTDTGGMKTSEIRRVDGAKWATLSNRRDAATVKLYRCATTATMLVVLAESLGAGKKWGF